MFRTPNMLGISRNSMIDNGRTVISPSGMSISRKNSYRGA
jgi:hypothetical protein